MIHSIECRVSRLNVDKWSNLLMKRFAKMNWSLICDNKTFGRYSSLANSHILDLQTWVSKSYTWLLHMQSFMVFRQVVGHYTPIRHLDNSWLSKALICEKWHIWKYEIYITLMAFENILSILKRLIRMNCIWTKLTRMNEIYHSLLFTTDPFW
jgi:hypothetical protein